jgi:hypothetical protein
MVWEMNLTPLWYNEEEPNVDSTIAAGRVSHHYLFLMHLDPRSEEDHTVEKGREPCHKKSTD